MTVKKNKIKFCNSFFSGFFKHIISLVLSPACDMRIISNSSRNGTIKSPGYPRDFPVNITCIYYIDGLYSQERLEKVKVKFTDFSIPGSMPE